MERKKKILAPINKIRNDLEIASVEGITCRWVEIEESLRVMHEIS
jgi:hypothetical protein